MRDLAKSMASLSLGMGMLAIREGARIFTPGQSSDAIRETGEFLDNVSRVTQEALGPDLRKAFLYGDEFQRRILDAGSGVMGDANTVDPSDVIRKGTEAVKRATDLLTRSHPED